MHVQIYVQPLARLVLSLLVVVFSLTLTACSPDRGSSEGDLNGSAGGAGTAVLQGGGATFPAPLYSKWLSEYSKANPGTRVDYQPTGSGAGIKGVQEGTIDFGGTDAPMTDEEMSKSIAPILHIPTVLGAVVLTYNLPGIAQPLRFSPNVVADIFLGRITRWNDARIAADNSGVNLPNAEINVVYRSDGSGTTSTLR